MKKKIAFICIHNSCRSQIAEALGKHFLGDKYDFYSAGTETKPRINRDAVRLLKEHYGIDMDLTQYSKTFSEIPAPDVAVSMGCDVACPYIGRDFDSNWGLPDPTGKSDEEFLKIIRQIEDNIKNLCFTKEADKMQRPYIICHMTTSLDGKVTGDFLFRKECVSSTEIYYEINRELECNGFICGRVTMEESFTGKWYPDLESYAEVTDRQDYIPDNLSGFYAVAFDTKGKLGWRSSNIIDPDGDEGYDNAQIIEVLSEQVNDKYLGYLKAMGIAYIFAGKDEIDVAVALEKLKSLFGIERLLLEGGSIINGSFLCADAVDELILVVAPTVADKDSKPLFYNSRITDFALMDTHTQDGVLILNYKRK